MPYDQRKGLEGPKIKKRKREKFLDQGQVEQLLRTVRGLKKTRWPRDHALIYLSYFFGLRCAEAVRLERTNFDEIEDGVVMLLTMKQTPRLPMQCRCGRKYRVSAKRLGETYPCPSCGLANRVNLPAGQRSLDLNPPHRSPPVVETSVRQYAMRYLSERMRPDQRWLFETTTDKHLSVTQARRIFNFYLVEAGLNPKLSFHALRHGRGVLVYEKFEDLVMVRDSLRHLDTATAGIYAQISPKKAEEYRSKLESIDFDDGLDNEEDE